MAHGQAQLDSTFTVDINRKDKRCESRTKLNSQAEQFYILNFTDTVYVTDFPVINKCIDRTTKISNPSMYCQLLSFGQPITGYYTENGYYGDSTRFWYSGTLQNGYYQNGEFMRFHPAKIPMICGQYSNGWKSGLWIMYSENGKVYTIYRFIEGCEDPVTEWNYNEKGELEYYNDEYPEIIKRIEQE